MQKSIFFLLCIIPIITLKHFPNLCLKHDNKKCYKCSYSYLTSSGFCKKPKYIIQNCLAYLTPLKCSSCKKGYSLQKTKRSPFEKIEGSPLGIIGCSKVMIKDCVAGPNINECFICKLGFKLDKNLNCSLKCEKKNCDYCSVFNGVEFCMECSKGFSLNEYMNCEKEPIQGCEIIKNGKCDSCKQGFFMKNFECLKNYVSVKKTKKSNFSIKDVDSVKGKNNNLFDIFKKDDISLKKNFEENDLVKAFSKFLSFIKITISIQFFSIIIFYM